VALCRSRIYNHQNQRHKNLRPAREIGGRHHSPAKMKHERALTKKNNTAGAHFYERRLKSRSKRFRGCMGTAALQSKKRIPGWLRFPGGSERGWGRRMPYKHAGVVRGRRHATPASFAFSSLHFRDLMPPHTLLFV
jgi:hypothetical protein